MRVIAFSCVHWMTRKTQVEVYGYDEPLDYGPFIHLCDLIISSQPDVVVNLGDFTEDFWEDKNDIPKLPDAYTLIQLDWRGSFYKIAGNHDRYGEQFIELDGVRYEHGHKLGLPGNFESQDLYVEALRENVRGAKIVHGHTHIPSEAWPLDVGSVTFSHTYGEIIDGTPLLKKL